MPGQVNCSLSAGEALLGKQQELLRLCNLTQRCHLHSAHNEDVPGVSQAHNSASHEVFQEKILVSGDSVDKENTDLSLPATQKNFNFRLMVSC